MSQIQILSLNVGKGIDLDLGKVHHGFWVPKSINFKLCLNSYYQWKWTAWPLWKKSQTWRAKGQNENHPKL